MKCGAVWLNGDDSRQRLFGVGASLDGDAERGRTLGNVDRLTADTDVRQRRSRQTGRLRKDFCLLISAQCAYKTKLKINFLTISLICVFKVHISQIQEVVESDAFVE